MKCDTCYIKYCDEVTENICKFNNYCKYMPEKKNKNELKLCPFCGGRAVIESYESSAFEVTHLGVHKWYYATCINCDAISSDEYTPEEATKKWNRRVSL